MTLANKVKPKIAKAIKKYGVDVEVFKKDINEFGEPMGENILVSKLKGLYSESNHYIAENIADKGKFKKDKTYKIIALFNDDSLKVLEGHVVIINDVMFEIVNKSDANMLEAYFEFTLKRC